MNPKAQNERLGFLEEKPLSDILQKSDLQIK